MPHTDSNPSPNPNPNPNPNSTPSPSPSPTASPDSNQVRASHHLELFCYGNLSPEATVDLADQWRA